ncbi:MAG: Bax inhibitor-1/YccA family protein [Bacteroidales bacterium]|nr:Bax inhibitor-1/YccA family protein [Candidatus Colicola faecequi]
MENLDFDRIDSTRHDDAIVATLMRNVYLWMTLALVITALTAMVCAKSEAFMALLFSSRALLWGVMIAELVLVMVFSARLMKMSFSRATLVFIIYSILNGIVFSTIFCAFSLGSIYTTFFVTAGTFAAMALVGSFSKKDLSGIGKFAIMALIGLIIAGIVNIFLRNTMFDLIVSGIGVLVFSALTAYDSQKIKQMLYTQSDIDDNSQKIALFGSLSLYLDFINLFLYLLRFFGSSRD